MRDSCTGRKHACRKQQRWLAASLHVSLYATQRCLLAAGHAALEYGVVVAGQQCDPRCTKLALRASKRLHNGKVPLARVLYAGAAALALMTRIPRRRCSACTTRCLGYAAKLNKVRELPGQHLRVPQCATRHLWYVGATRGICNTHGLT